MNSQHELVRENFETFVPVSSNGIYKLNCTCKSICIKTTKWQLSDRLIEENCQSALLENMTTRLLNIDAGIVTKFECSGLLHFKAEKRPRWLAVGEAISSPFGVCKLKVCKIYVYHRDESCLYKSIIYLQNNTLITLNRSDMLTCCIGLTLFYCVTRFQSSLSDCAHICTRLGCRISTALIMNFQGQSIPRFMSLNYI